MIVYWTDTALGHLRGIHEYIAQHTAGFEALDFSALRVTFAGGMALQGVVAERWKKVTGCPVTQGWGLTETSPVATANPIGGQAATSGRSGLLLQNLWPARFTQKE